MSKPWLQLKTWASVNPKIKNTTMSVSNFVNGQFTSSSSSSEIFMNLPDPLNKHNSIFQQVPNHKSSNQVILDQLKSCPKYGLHNPYLNVNRYVRFGELCHRLGCALDDAEIEDFFTKLIQRVMPKSYVQACGEVKVTKAFLKTFAGDSSRFFIGRGFSVTGDHDGQRSNGYRFPYGPVAVIAPFNFPMEIPVLQMMGAMIAGNLVLLKPSEKVAVVVDQFVRLMLACDKELVSSSLIVLNGNGKVVEDLICSNDSPIRLTQFTGSSTVAEMLAEKTRGKIKMEDAGFNWKILGPLTNNNEKQKQINVDYVAWQCDQDAYAASGQKCSAQSCLFLHESWVR